MTNRWKVYGRRMAALFMSTALILVSCTQRSESENLPPAEDSIPARIPGLGVFLAGRIALAQGDSRAAADYYAAALRFAPDDEDILRRTFMLMVMEGRMEAALPLAERVHAKDKEDPIATVLLGLDAAQKGDLATAEGLFSALPSKGIFLVLEPLLLSWSQAGQNHIDEALQTLVPLRTLKGASSLGKYHAGLINDMADRAEAANTDYTALLDERLSLRAVEAAGGLLQRTGKLDAAKTLYEKYEADRSPSLLFNSAVRLKAGSALPRSVPDVSAGLVEALLDVAALLRQGGSHEISTVLTQLALHLQPQSGLAQLTVAEALVEQRRLDEAVAIYHAIAPGSSMFQWGQLRAATVLDSMGDSNAAIAALDALAEANPQATDPSATKGDLLRNKKKFAEAAVAYTQAIERLPTLLPSHWLLFFGRGISYERSQQWPKAEADFLKALELKPDESEVLNYLGYSWVEHGSHLDEARAMLEKAVKAQPENGAIIDSLGWALFRLGLFAESVQHLERAAELSPENSTINNHLGDAYYRVGRIAEAMFQWQRAANLTPEPEEVDPLSEKIKAGGLPPLAGR